MAAVRDFHSKRTCLLTQTSPSMKVDCSAPCAPAIAASIRNPGFRPTYSYWLARPIAMTLRVQARSGSWLLSRTFIVKIYEICKQEEFEKVVVGMEPTGHY